MKPDFNDFFNQLSETNATLDYFTDFSKVKENVKNIELKLNILNYLLGKQNLSEAVRDLYQECPNAFSVLEILIAVRQEDEKKALNNHGQVVYLKDYLTSADKIIEFLKDTGLENIFKDRNIKNLVDYVFGIEVGLDTNARKNRGGKNMSKKISLLFDKSNIYYQKEVKNIFLTNLKKLGGTAVKQFDFVIKTQTKTYLIEINFFNAKGSKLNEVTRSFKDLAKKINKHPKYEFVWITDGQGWEGSKNNLQDAYKCIPSVYNLATINDFIQKIQAEGIIDNWK